MECSFGHHDFDGKGIFLPLWTEEEPLLAAAEEGMYCGCTMLGEPVPWGTVCGSEEEYCCSAAQDEGIMDAIAVEDSLCECVGSAEDKCSVPAIAVACSVDRAEDEGGIMDAIAVEDSSCECDDKVIVPSISSARKKSSRRALWLDATFENWMHLLFVGIHAWLGRFSEDDALVVNYWKGKKRLANKEIPMRRIVAVLLQVVVPTMVRRQERRHPSVTNVVRRRYFVATVEDMAAASAFSRSSSSIGDMKMVASKLLSLAETRANATPLVSKLRGQGKQIWGHRDAGDDPLLQACCAVYLVDRVEQFEERIRQRFDTYRE